MSLLNLKLLVNLNTLRSQSILNNKLVSVCLNNISGYKDLPNPPKETGKI